jgi:hypothetical protein
MPASEEAEVTPHKFLAAVRSRAARIASGGSAMRGAGNSGCSAAARAALRELDVAPFSTKDATTFRQRLDEETQRLRARLPRGAQYWGLARKVLNIYLRDCFYTTYLEREYRLTDAEQFLELPLDSVVATELRKGRSDELPRWTAIKDLTPKVSALYQAAATDEAAKHRIARVHLDAVWWSLNRD